MSGDSAWREAVLRRIFEHLGGNLNPCEVCGHQEWCTADGFVQMNTFRQIEPIHSPEAFKGGVISGLWFVVLSCDECGNTKFLDAIGLGLSDLVSEAQRM